MTYRLRTTPAFRRALSKLTFAQKDSAARAFVIFKKDPFDPRLHAHKIHHLSALYGKTIYSIRIEGDLRSVFYQEGNDIISVDIGTHAIYRS